MDDSLPVALVHLREAEIVRLCSLARSARGQEAARLGRVRQAERAAGTLRAMVLEGEITRAVTAHFSESGLEAWNCECSPAQPDQNTSSPGIHAPCEHVAALLALWVRAPEQFRVPALAPERVSADDFSESAAPTPDTSEPAVAGPAELAAAPTAALADLDRLDQDMRRCLNVLALAGGSVTEHEAQRLFASLEAGSPEGALAALERLYRVGFVQPVFAAAPSRHAAAASPAGWSIPDTLLEQLSPVLPLTPLAEALPSAEGWHEESAALALPLLLQIAAQMVDRTAPPLMTALTPKAASRSTLDLDAALAQHWAPQLQTTPERARFCLGLLRLLGVLPQTTPPRVLAPPSASSTPLRGQPSASVAYTRPVFSAEQARETLLSAYRLLLARPEAEAARDLFTHWLHAHSARELLELRDAGVRVAWLKQRQSRHTAAIAAENQAARQFVVHLLRYAPAGRWWNFSSLVEFVWRFQPGFLRGRQQTFLRPEWWLERLPDGHPLALDVRAEWRQAEGRYIALLLRRSLHWLGVVDLALDGQGRLKGFRITPLGAYLLGAEAQQQSVPVSAPASVPLALQPTLQLEDDGTLLAALSGLQGEQLETLLWWCEPAGATAQALRFRPSAERLAAALDVGQDLAAWLAWLEHQPQTAALTALLEQLISWAALYGQVRLYDSVTLLEVADPSLLHELEMTLDLAAQYLDHAPGSGLAVVRSDAVETLVEEMQRRGYAPWSTTDEPSNRP